MAHILLFPSVLGVRRGVTDLTEALTGAGHSVSTVDVLDGETFDDYATASARSQEIGFPAQKATALERTKGDPPSSPSPSPMAPPWPSGSRRSDRTTPAAS